MDKNELNLTISIRRQQLQGWNSFYRKILRKQISLQTKFGNSDLKGHYGCVNAIEFSHGTGQFVASGGDDRRILLWDLRKVVAYDKRPVVFVGQHNSNIFCIAFDMHNRTIFSGGNDEQVLIHDVETQKLRDVYVHDDVVYGLSSEPTNDNVFASACDDGTAFIYDMRLPYSDALTLAKYNSPMHSVMYNPVEPRLVVTANAKEGVGLWDVRRPKHPILRYGSTVQQSCMNARISQSGERLIAIRRRLPLVLYDIKQRLPLCEFDHQSYYNSCTMKSCCFAGDNDEYVLSGSDDFNLYMWKIPNDLSTRSFNNNAHSVLKGHRSIVNQVRSNPLTNCVISSGVEKVIKVWHPVHYEISHEKHEERMLYTHEEYINLILNSGQGMSHDYSQRSEEEEPRMMAFFDSLVQREIEGWSSDDDMSSNDEELYRRIIQVSQTDSDSPDTEVGEGRLSPFSRGFVTVMASRLVANSPEGRLLQPYVELDESLSVPTNVDVSNSVINNMSTSHVNTSSDLSNGTTVVTMQSNNTDASAGSKVTDASLNTSIDLPIPVSSEGTSSETNLFINEPNTQNELVKPESKITDSICENHFGNSSDCSIAHHLNVEKQTVSSHGVQSSSEIDNSETNLDESSPVDSGFLESPRRVSIDITGAELRVQASPLRSIPPMCRRRISQLIAWRRDNSNKHIKRVKRRIVSSSDSSDPETSVDAVRRKVTGQSNVTKKNKQSYAKTENGTQSPDSLREHELYMSDESRSEDFLLQTKRIGDKKVPVCQLNNTLHSKNTLLNKQNLTKHQSEQSATVLKNCTVYDNDIHHKTNSKSLNYDCAPSTSKQATESKHRSEINTHMKTANNTNLVFPNTMNFHKRDESLVNNHTATQNLDLTSQSSENAQPVWTEFKRFKNRMKRAERYYRRNTQQNSRNKSSDEETNDT